MKLSGGCSCGAVRYETDSNLSNRCICHCQSCRRASGAPFVAWATSARDHFTVTRGELTFFASSVNVQRGFCAHCGTALTYANTSSPTTLDIALASLDDPDIIAPEFHIWLDDKLSWVSIDDGLPTYPGWRSQTEPN